MKLASSNFLAAAAVAFAVTVSLPALVSGQGECPLIVPEPWDRVQVKAVRAGSVPTTTTADYTYNMAVVDTFADLYFIDNVEGIIYKFHDDDGTSTVIFDKSDPVTFPVPDGVDLDIEPPLRPPFFLGPNIPDGNSIYTVQTMAPGPNEDTVYIVFTSSTVPEGINALPLPPDNPAGDYSGNLPLRYFVFVKYDFTGGVLSKSVPFFALTHQTFFGVHYGGGISPLPNNDGRILYAVGDCAVLGLNGQEAAQSLDSHCAKLLLIDPSTPNSYEIVAKGLRNTQYLSIVDDQYVVFADPGGITAEEVNTVPLSALLDTSHIENFGWGIIPGQEFEGQEFGREGTFYVARGGFFEGDSPACLGEWSWADLNPYTSPYIRPWIQFGRSPDWPFFAVSGAVVSRKSFDRIKVLATEFNTGLLIVALSLPSWLPFRLTPAYLVELTDETGDVVLEGGFNNLTAQALGLDEPVRGDPRLFRFPDGTAGVFMERTGEFFKLYEVQKNNCWWWWC